jgi:DNA-binding MurR/RpiR family transcriptional regulator
MKNDVLQAIRAQMGAFSKGQKRVATYILENYEKAAFMTAGRLGKEANVSESTVVRFAAEVGFEGYPSMQKALQELIRGRLTSVQRIRVSRELSQSDDVVAEVLHRDMESIHAAIEQVDRSAFRHTVDLLLKAQRIYILGVRSSSFLAGYLNFYLHLILKNVVLVYNASAGEIYEQLVHIGPGDVLVGISFPRYAIMTVNAVNYAHDRGAEVIAITDSTLSPLYAPATASLLVRSDMFSFVDSMAAPLSLLNALIVELGHLRKDEVDGVFAEMEKVWEQHSIFGITEDE